MIIKKSTYPDAKHRGCCSHKVVAVGFYPLHYGAEHRGMKTSARIIFYCRKIAEHYRYAKDNSSRQPHTFERHRTFRNIFLLFNYRPQQHKGNNPLHDKSEYSDNGKKRRLKHRQLQMKNQLVIGKKHCK